MERFRIVHISDPHFCIWPNRRNWGRLFRQAPALSLEHFLPISFLGFPTSFAPDLAETAARIIFEKRDEFDLIVISGDLATTAHVEYLRTARDFTHGNASRGYLTASGEPTIVSEDKNKLVLPGNHDRFRDLFGSSADPHFDLVFGPPLWTAPVDSRVLEKDGTYLAIVAADFALHQDSDAEPIVFVNRAGRGMVYDNVLERLIRRTREIRSAYQDAAVVWVVHFPPTETSPSVFRLLRSEVLEDAAEANSVQVLMSGHLHRNVEFRTRHAKPILCAGTLASSGGDNYNWFHFVEFNVEKDRVLKCEKDDFKWDDTEGDFVQLGVREVSLTAMV